MKKKKNLVGICLCVCLVFIAIAVIFMLNRKEGIETNKGSLAQIKENFETDIQALKDGKYENLISTDFISSIEDVEGVYNIEIQTDNSWKDRTYLENFAIMDKVIDKFFVEEFDKSYLVADPYMPDGENSIRVNYHDVEKVFADEEHTKCYGGFLFGSKHSEGGYMVQTTPSLVNTWFSRGELEEIHPSGMKYRKVYSYISGIRQDDDAILHLQDGEIALSEMENRVLTYLNGEEFPLPISDEISYGIGDVRILENGNYDGVCFKVRRIYKGIPFEYGANVSSDMYIDDMNNDTGEIAYAVSTYPDTMLSFGKVNGTVVETDIISDMLSAGDALKILSEKIGENSVYEVHGVELVYRCCEIPEERLDELEDILTPRWKIITMNQNDDKYTLFYVDVVTGEITERFEYYYD